MECPNKIQLRDYVWDKLLDTESEFEIAEHINGCQKCLSIAQEENILKNFWEIYDSNFYDFSFQMHKKACWSKALSEGIRSTKQNKGAIERYLKNLLMNDYSLVGPILQVSVDNIFPQIKNYSKYSDLSVNLPKTSFQSFTCTLKGEIYNDSRISLCIKVDSENIFVRFEKGVQLPPSVILINSKGRTIIGKPEILFGESIYSISFKNLESGEYFLIFEPEYIELEALKRMECLHLRQLHIDKKFNIGLIAAIFTLFVISAPILFNYFSDEKNLKPIYTVSPTITSNKGGTWDNVLYLKAPINGPTLTLTTKDSNYPWETFGTTYFKVGIWEEYRVSMAVDGLAWLSPITVTKNNESEFEWGYCQMVSPSDGVYALVDGGVVVINDDSIGAVNLHFGNQILIRHSDPLVYNGREFYSLYSHLSHLPNVEIGKQIYRGQEIGRVSTTGTPKYHLHFEISQNLTANLIINTATRNPTHYMASEDSTFDGAKWIRYTHTPTFTLSAENSVKGVLFIVKRVLFKVRNNDGEAPPVSNKIPLEKVLNISITSLAINNGANSTNSQTVTLNNSATGNPTHYKASENTDFKRAGWKPYSTNPTFRLSKKKGLKTVYFKVKNKDVESNPKKDIIDLK